MTQEAGGAIANSGVLPIVTRLGPECANYAVRSRNPGPECEYPGACPGDLLFFLASVRKQKAISATRKVQPPAEEYGEVNANSHAKERDARGTRTFDASRGEI